MYTVDYFIKKFEAIAEDKWCINMVEDDDGRHCAWGHLLYSEHKIDDCRNEGAALMKILREAGLDQKGDPSDINNGDHKNYQQPTHKQRILAALYDIKAMQNKDIDTGGKEEKKERIVYVSVPVTIAEQSKYLVLS